ncbi:Os05g0233300 [Oryza sativa Japonica Group]|uniref:Os05g0233300 protein n=1 Tax=Oryza sativa subsp. japonica TaxID=39947 RepID=A0A0P0WJI3_ORYSJ|nr:Os05g0233300 [Oryza sativa Japonica Group]
MAISLRPFAYIANEILQSTSTNCFVSSESPLHREQTQDVLLWGQYGESFNEDATLHKSKDGIVIAIFVGLTAGKFSGSFFHPNKCPLIQRMQNISTSLSPAAITEASSSSATEIYIDLDTPQVREFRTSTTIHNTGASSKSTPPEISLADKTPTEKTSSTRKRAIDFTKDSIEETRSKKLQHTEGKADFPEDSFEGTKDIGGIREHVLPAGTMSGSAIASLHA